MMQAYVSIGVKSKQSLASELEAIKQALTDREIKPLVFVEQYQFTINEENDMMKQAMADIDASDFLIAEITVKAIGVGLEVGYAKGRRKPVVYIRNRNAEHSTTVAGVSDYMIFYNDSRDLYKQLSAALQHISTDA